MDYKKFAKQLRNQAGSYALFYGAPQGDLEKAADVIEELAARLEPSSTPLAQEELRRMGGEPVWVTPAKEGGKILKRWMLLECFSEDIDLFLFRPSCGIAQGYTGAGYGKIWLAYRRRPEEGKM